jgi:hypothetical protein
MATFRIAAHAFSYSVRLQLLSVLAERLDVLLNLRRSCARNAPGEVYHMACRTVASGALPAFSDEFSCWNTSEAAKSIHSRHSRLVSSWRATAARRAGRNERPTLTRPSFDGVNQRLLNQAID